MLLLLLFLWLLLLLLLWLLYLLMWFMIIILVIFVILQDIKVLSRNQRPDEQSTPWCCALNSTQNYHSVPQPFLCSYRRALCRQHWSKWWLKQYTQQHCGLELKHVPNAEKSFYCPQAFLSLDFQHTDDSSEFFINVLGLKRAVVQSRCRGTAHTHLTMCHKQLDPNQSLPLASAAPAPGGQPWQSFLQGSNHLETKEAQHLLPTHICAQSSSGLGLSAACWQHPQTSTRLNSATMTGKSSIRGPSDGMAVPWFQTYNVCFPVQCKLGFPVQCKLGWACSVRQGNMACTHVDKVCVQFQNCIRMFCRCMYLLPWSDICAVSR